MTFQSTLSTCRFCKASSFDGDGMTKYGVRHYAHFKCYVDAGKPLSDLHAWQINEFPFFLLKKSGLLDEAGRLIAEKNNPNKRPRKVA